ncbi:hypothetical protein ACWEO9_21805 [Streptomyces albidoflavus]
MFGTALHDRGKVALDPGGKLVAFGQGLIGDEDLAQVVDGLCVAACPAAGQRLQVVVGQRPSGEGEGGQEPA